MGFLRDCGLMDYSLLVGIERDEEQKNFTTLQRKQSYLKTDNLPQRESRFFSDASNVSQSPSLNSHRGTKEEDVATKYDKTS